MMRINIVAWLSAAILALLSASTCADTIYKCKNLQGELIYQGSPCKDVQEISSWVASTDPKQQDNEFDKSVNSVLTIKQGGGGHYYLEGLINGKPLTFVIDTGASSVALPREVAMSAQIYCRDKILVQTANGVASACTAIIPKLQFGPFLVKNATAMISSNLNQPLLGMSVLQQFKIEQDGGEMRISVRH